MRIIHKGKMQIITAIILYALSLTILTILNISFSLYYFSVIAVLLFVINMEIYWKKENRTFEKQLLELDWLLSEVRHRYYVHGMVDEAAREAYEVCKTPGLKEKIYAIYEALCSVDMNLAKEKFKHMNQNRYFRMFLTLSLMVMEFGDKAVEGQSLYLRNLKRLREEIHIELKNNQTLKHHFSGLTFLIVVPITTLGAIESWGLSNLPELSSYYDGAYRILFYAFLFILTVGLYYLFFLLKTPIKVISKQHPWLKLVSKHSLFIRYCRNYEHFFPRAFEKLRISLIQVGETMEISEFLCKRIICGFLGFSFSFLWTFFFLMHLWKGKIIILVLLSSILCFYLPVWVLKYRVRLAKVYMEDEVFQFQAILMMVMYMDRISTFELLEIMEDFSIIFKKQLRQCLLDYDVGQREALLQLKENTYCEAFHKLIDNLIMCDDIGVTKALDEVALEIQFYSEKRQQQTNYQLEQKGILCRFLSFLPLVTTIALYLILPFVTVSLSKLMEISDAIATGK